MTDKVKPRWVLGVGYPQDGWSQLHLLDLNYQPTGDPGTREAVRLPFRVPCRLQGHPACLERGMAFAVMLELNPWLAEDRTVRFDSPADEHRFWQQSALEAVTEMWEEISAVLKKLIDGETLG